MNQKEKALQAIKNRTAAWESLEHMKKALLDAEEGTKKADEELCRVIRLLGGKPLILDNVMYSIDNHSGGLLEVSPFEGTVL